MSLCISWAHAGYLYTAPPLVGLICSPFTVLSRSTSHKYIQTLLECSAKFFIIHVQSLEVAWWILWPSMSEHPWLLSVKCLKSKISPQLPRHCFDLILCLTADCVCNMKMRSYLNVLRLIVQLTDNYQASTWQLSFFEVCLERNNMWIKICIYKVIKLVGKDKKTLLKPHKKKAKGKRWCPQC